VKLAYNPPLAAVPVSSDFSLARVAKSAPPSKRLITSLASFKAAVLAASFSASSYVYLL
jgi:hypothetical protein